MKKLAVPEKWRHLKKQTIDVLSSRDFWEPREAPFHSLIPLEEGRSGPICTSIAYTFESAQDAADIFSGRTHGYAYPRYSKGTPPINELSARLLDLELGADHPDKQDYDVLLNSSGMAAIAMTMMTLCSSQTHRSFLCPNYMYGGTNFLLTDLFPRLHIWPLQVSNPLDMGEWEDTFKKHKSEGIACVYAEDEANPTPIKLDNARLAKFAHRNGMLYVCDRTIGTPILERPLLTGTDVVIHSLSKNINGRSSALGGVIIGRKPIVDHIRDTYFPGFGPVMDARVADEILVNMRDLKHRMMRKIKAAAKIHDFLLSHPRVKRVYGPGGDLLAFEIDGTLNHARRVVAAYRLITFVPHLGDIRTLSVHPASTTHAKIHEDMRKKLGITDTLIRVSVGMEHPDDIIDDLAQALDAAYR